MVSNCCKMYLKKELTKLNYTILDLDLGEVEIKEEISMEEMDELKYRLMKIGLVIMDDKKAMIVERIKTTIIDMVHHSKDYPKTNFSDYVAEKLDYEYAYLTSIFSENTGYTIESFIIKHKIERVKEYLIYDELNLTEIADMLHL